MPNISVSNLSLTDASALAGASYNPSGHVSGYRAVDIQNPVLAAAAGANNIVVLNEIVNGSPSNNYVISYRGTHSVLDVIADVAIKNGLVPNKARDSLAVTRNILEQLTADGTANVILVGHSLGGFVAEWIGANILLEDPSELGLGAFSALGINSPTIPRSGWELGGGLEPGAFSDNIFSLNTVEDPVSGITQFMGGEELGRRLNLDAGLSAADAVASCVNAYSEFESLRALAGASSVTGNPADLVLYQLVGRQKVLDLKGDIGQCTLDLVASHGMSPIGGSDSIGDIASSQGPLVETFGEVLNDYPGLANFIIGIQSRLPFGQVSETNDLPILFTEDGSVLYRVSVDNELQTYIFNALNQLVSIQSSRFNSAFSYDPISAAMKSMMVTGTDWSNSELWNQRITKYDHKATATSAEVFFRNGTRETTEFNIADDADWFSHAKMYDGVNGSILTEEVLLRDGTLVSRSRASGSDPNDPDSYTRKVQRADKPLITAAQIGQIFGSNLGKLLVDDNVFAQRGVRLARGRRRRHGARNTDPHVSPSAGARLET